MTPLLTAERLMERTTPEPTTGCFLWTGSHGGQNYGFLTYLGVRVPAHRMSWELHFGQIPNGLLVCHKCDNPPCINPDHLFLGTHKDNSDDMVRKGREGWTRRIGPRFRCGAFHHQPPLLSEAGAAKLRLFTRPTP